MTTILLIPRVTAELRAQLTPRRAVLTSLVYKATPRGLFLTAVAMTSVVIFLLGLVLPLVSSQSYHWGACPDPKVQPNFNLQQFLGKWYEIEKLPASFERGKCIEANYVTRSDGTIQVLNSQFYKEKFRTVEGTAVIPDPREPASVAVVYSCTDILHLFHVDYAWILGRARFMEHQTLLYAKQLL
ncbi:hypothetical protein CRUP_028329, partial [Coryphaenoides rupestris]